MPLTNESKVEALLRLPWTVRVERSDEGYFVARCVELPGSLATGSEAEIENAFWESLRATLACVVEDGDDAIPLPNGVRALPWKVKHNPTRLAPLVADDSVLTESAGAVAVQRDLVAA